MENSWLYGFRKISLVVIRWFFYLVAFIDLAGHDTYMNEWFEEARKKEFENETFKTS